MGPVKNPQQSFPLSNQGEGTAFAGSGRLNLRKNPPFRHINGKGVVVT
jgi:hypothetical protein